LTQKSRSYCSKEDFMPERLVDVERQGSGVLHTFPVTLGFPADQEGFKRKALEATAHASLVPNNELEILNAKMHVGRGGQQTPFRDAYGALAETKAGLDQVVRERAFCTGSRKGGRMDASTTLAPGTASALLRMRLRVVGAGGVRKGQGGRVLVSHTRAFEES
jgi:hypothetical protein